MSESLFGTEPGLRTLQQTAEQLFVNPKGIEEEGRLIKTVDASEGVPRIPESGDMMERILELNHKLKIQQRLIQAYIAHLRNTLEEESPPDGATAGRLLNLSHQVNSL